MLEILAKIKRKIYCFCFHNGTLGGLTDAEVLPVLTLATTCSKPTETPLPTKLADLLLTISVEILEFPEISEISDLSEIFVEVEVDKGAEVLPIVPDTASAAFGTLGPFLLCITVFSLTISVEISEIPEFLEISGISEIFEEVEVEVGAEVLPIVLDTASAAFGVLGTSLLWLSVFSGRIFVEILEISEISEISVFPEIF